MKKVLIIIFIIVVIIVFIVYLFSGSITRLLFSTTGISGDLGVGVEQVESQDIEVIAQNLLIPWEVVLLPGGDLIVTERPGNFIRIGVDRQVTKIEGVEHIGEGGLQGLAVHPDFQNNSFIYLYLTTQVDEELTNRVERYKLLDGTLYDREIIISGLPGAKFHDGGRIAFGPDGKLYITVGDAGQADRAQSLDYLGGKILRINDDGSIPEDNPLQGSPVYSYGHRNPQGLAFDSEGNLWITEHGRSIPRSGLDELNKIEPGKNYGWPIVEGDEVSEGMTSPVIHSGASVTWAPAGVVYYDGSLFFAGLRGEALYEYDIETGSIKTHFFKEFGRLRAVSLGHDGFFYVSTSNTDGRGSIKEGDDKIIRIKPIIFR